MVKGVDLVTLYLEKVGILKKDNKLLQFLKSHKTATMNSVLDNPIDRTMTVNDSYQTLAAKIKDLDYSEVKKGLPKYFTSIGGNKDKDVWESLRKVSPKMEGNEVPTSLRNLFRYPFFTIIFKTKKVISRVKILVQLLHEFLA